MSPAPDPLLPISSEASVTISDASSMLAELFERHGLDDAKETAKILVCAAANCSRLSLLSTPKTPITETSLKLLDHFAQRRLRREPVSRILGTREFWGLELRITPAVLDPRPDTETIVEACIRWTRAKGLTNPKVLDLGTGSGAVLCAVLSELPEAKGVGIDVSATACEVAEDNLSALGLSRRGKILCLDIAEFNGSGFDIVLSNPPYVRSSDIEALDLEVKAYDPHLALDGGPDGLDLYRVIFSKYKQWVRNNFFCCVEIGHDQGLAVSQMLQSIGATGRLEKDISGNDRIVFWES